MQVWDSASVAQLEHLWANEFTSSIHFPPLSIKNKLTSKKKNQPKHAQKTPKPTKKKPQTENKMYKKTQTKTQEQPSKQKNPKTQKPPTQYCSSTARKCNYCDNLTSSLSGLLSPSWTLLYSLLEGYSHK